MSRPDRDRLLRIRQIMSHVGVGQELLPIARVGPRALHLDAQPLFRLLRRTLAIILEDISFINCRSSCHS